MGSEQEITQILEESLSPVRYAFLHSQGIDSHYLCIESNSEKFHLGSSKSLYQLPAVLRTYTQKSQILSADTLEAFYDEFQTNELCYILKSEEFTKRIVIFDLDNLEHFKKDEFVQKLRTYGQKLNNAFSKAFYRYYNEKMEAIKDD